MPLAAAVLPGVAHVWVLEDPDHGVLLVIELLGGVEAAGVPLTHSHLQKAENKLMLKKSV